MTHSHLWEYIGFGSQNNEPKNKTYNSHFALQPIFMWKMYSDIQIAWRKPFRGNLGADK